MNKPKIIASIFIVLLCFTMCEEEKKKHEKEELEEDYSGDSGTFLDVRDIQRYKWVRIGDQIWMAENLNFPTESGSCYYDFDPTNGDYYGRLYTWEAAKNASPPGWHIPTDDEWKELELSLGMSQSQVDSGGCRGVDYGAKLKSTDFWYNNGNGTDDYGFCVMPSGFRSSGGFCVGMGRRTAFWNAIPEGRGRGIARYFTDDCDGICRHTSYYLFDYHCIRCVKDE